MSKFRNETYFEMGTGFEDPFTRVPNCILDEKNISAKALGIYVKIIRFQNSTTHKIYISSLANQLVEGVDAIRSGINELMNLGYIHRYELRNEKGQRNGYRYVVHAQPIENTTNVPELGYPTLDNPELDGTLHKKKIGLKENKKKENKDVVVDEAETQLVDLYRTFKLEKRVMPHTIKLLKDNTHISLNVFEQIFIAAVEDSVSKKYAYIKKIVDELNTSNITTIEQFEKYNQDYKKSKTVTKVSSKKKNRFDNFDGALKDMSKDEVKGHIDVSQNVKFGDGSLAPQKEVSKETDFRKQFYEKAMKEGWNKISNAVLQQAIGYANQYGLEYPTNL